MTLFNIGDEEKNLIWEILIILGNLFNLNCPYKSVFCAHNRNKTVCYY